MLTYFIILNNLIIFITANSSTLNTGWIDYTFSSGIYCSSVSNVCSKMGHFVFWIEPTNPVINYIGGGYISFNDNQTWQPGGNIAFEQHYFSFNNSLRVQVYNFLYESFFTLDSINQYNSSCIDVKLFLNDNTNGNLPQFLQLPECFRVNPIIYNISTNNEQLSYYDHGNATIECSKSMNLCRFVVHVIFKYAPIGDFINNYNYIGNGELYINNETKPTNLTGNLNVLWWKQMIYLNNTWYHGSHWGFDHIGDYQYLSNNIHVVCWKVYVRDLQYITNQGDTQKYYIPMDGGDGGYQKSKYVRCYEPEIHFWD